MTEDSSLSYTSNVRTPHYVTNPVYVDQESPASVNSSVYDEPSLTYIVAMSVICSIVAVSQGSSNVTVNSNELF